MKNKIVSTAEAVAIIRDGDTVAFSGFVGSGTPEELIAGLERRFLDTGSPRNLTLLFAAAPGDGKERGLNRLAHEGLVKRAVGGHWSLVPKLAALAVAGKIEAYNLPLGTLTQVFRDIAGHRAGTLTKVGLRTFVDPRQQGGRINDRTTEDLVRLMEIDGEEWLFYRAFPVSVAFLRGTTADVAGNITMEREALTLDNLALAMAARNSNGFVIAQVERVCAQGALNPRHVQVPGVLVDCVVTAKPEHHHQTYATVYSPAYAGEYKVPLDSLPPLPLDERKLIARRCAFDLPMGGVVNLGIGMPEGVAQVANEEKVLRYVTLTAEPGVIGGLPQSGLDFGAAINTDAVIHQNQQFDFYDGGGLDMACLGMAQVDAQGNVNVSRFGPKLAGAGGFINISQSARRVLFAGSFTAGGLEVKIAGGRLSIMREGKAKKFVRAVEQITFNGAYAAETGQPVLYVTERCVFRRTRDGMLLDEVAPGIDIACDILAQMDFAPIVDRPRVMDPRIFRDEPMQLEDTLLGLGLAERISYDVSRNTIFLNLEGLQVRTRDDVDRVRRVVEELCQKVGKKVALVVNYDNFQIDPAVADTYAAMIRYMETHYYTTASRYTTSAFLRLKLGEALARRRVAPHIFETAEEADAFVRAGGVPPHAA
ncbi:MAG TPA: acyl CoA:acetate/3-ketoacid CoA transferase [Casimicrobiaceae bacterium]|nr:acyl CoA:acetate/3-ketoacid CoA transferase [Casimicrobiaceae bacterium]